MSSLGQTLRQAREAKGLSQSKVAAETRILVQIIDDIENEDFHRIAAPIYGRGFVRLFAECVGLAPQPLIREFMDIYAGRRAPTVHVREVPVRPAPEPQSIPTPAPEPESILATPSLQPGPEPCPAPIPEQEAETEPEAPAPIIPFASPPPEQPTEASPVPTSESITESIPKLDIEPFAQPISTPEPEPAPEPSLQSPPDPHLPAEPPQSVRGLDLFDQAALSTPPVSERPADPPPTAADMESESPFLPPAFNEEGPSAADRFRTGLSSVSHGVVRSMRKIPRSAWRKTVLVLGAVVIVALLIWGCVKLYQMTTPSTPPENPSCENGACEFIPDTKPAAPQKNATDKTVKTQPSTSTRTETKKDPEKIRSTGQKIPALYVD